MALIENGGKLKDNLTVSTVCQLCLLLSGGLGEVGSGVLAVHILWSEAEEEAPEKQSHELRK